MTYPMLEIPVSAAQAIATRYGYDQVIVIARRVGDDPDPHGEHVTTYGRDKTHCGVAARVGNFIKHKIMGWPEYEPSTEAAAAIKTLQATGYTYHGGELWKPPLGQAPASTQAARDVIAERQRQISAEGWTPEHDDAHGAGDLAIAGVCYASNAATFLQRGTDALRKDYKRMSPGARWPWLYEWWKPTNERRDLVKAGALILAEIERLDRAAVKDGAA